MKKILLIASALSITISTGCQAASSEAAAVPAMQNAKSTVQLTDIASHWAQESIRKAVDKGYVDGYEDTTFRPELNVSRAEFLKMAVTAMKLPVTGNVTGSEWYKPFVEAAKEKGILRATDFPLEDINKPISRLEMARISVRSTDVKLQNKDVQIDDKSVMYNATKTGLVQGLSYGELGPEKSTTRAQSVTIIERILSVNSGGKLEVDKYALNNAELELKHTNIFSVMPEFFGGKPYQGEEWNPSNLSVQSDDGNYKGTLDQLIAIDLDDPNDPNLGLLPNFDKIKWFNLMSYKDSLYIKDFKHSYVLYFKEHVDYNNAPDVYGSYAPAFSTYGFNQDDTMSLVKGKLNMPAGIFYNQIGDIPALIIPKSGYTLLGNDMGISISDQARPPHRSAQKNLIHSLLPNN